MTSDARYPCQRDFELNGTDWSESSPPPPVAKVQEMVELCQGCPFKGPCEALGDAGQVDAEGVFQRPSEGVWGGWFYRNAGGRAHKFDPRLPRTERPSIYWRTHWDKIIGRWKAEAQVGPRKRHIGYFDNEDEAGLAAFAWTLEHQREKIDGIDYLAGHSEAEDSGVVVDEDRRALPDEREGGEALGDGDVAAA